MGRQKLISQAVDLFKQEMKIIRDERDLLLKREDLCFERFLVRCNKIKEMTFFERWKELSENEMEP